MNNWEAVHECQDEQDAKRLRKRAEITAESLIMTQLLSRPIAGLDSDNVDVEPLHKPKAKINFDVGQSVRLLEQSQWLKSTALSMPSAAKDLAPFISFPNPHQTYWGHGCNLWNFKNRPLHTLIETHKNHYLTQAWIKWQRRSRCKCKFEPGHRSPTSGFSTIQVFPCHTQGGCLFPQSLPLDMWMNLCCIFICDCHHVSHYHSLFTFKSKKKEAS